MARPRTIKRKRKGKSKQPTIPFVPESLQAFTARRFLDAFALSLLAGALFIVAALASYSPVDPSWNTASSEVSEDDVANLGALPGAWTADVLLQTLGAGAFTLAVVLGFWAWRLFRRQTIRPVSLRLAAALILSILASVALAQIPSGHWIAHPYLGSSVGSLMLNQLSAFSQAYGLGYGPAVFSLFCALLAVPVFIYAAAFSRDEVAAAAFAVKVGLYTAIGTCIASVRGFLNWVQHYNAPDYETDTLSFGLLEKVKAWREERAARREAARDSEEEAEEEEDAVTEVKGRTQDDEIEDDETDEAPLVAQRPKSQIPVVTPSSAKKPASARKKSAAQQANLALADVADWQLPDITLIQEVPKEVVSRKPNEESLRKNAELLQNVLADFNIHGDISSIHPGPVVTLYELEPAPGTKTSRVISLSDDIARSMSAISVRCAVVPGRNVIGIELPNKERQTVYMREMLESRLYEKTNAKLPLILGKDIGGQPVLADLAKMPHLLVAGTTGSGKSVAVNTMIMSLLFRLSPQQCRFIMIDPKMLELSVYDNIPHLLSPVVTEPGKAIVALKWAVREMENRYRNMSKLGVRNIEGYNLRIREALKKGEEIVQKVQTGIDRETGEAEFEDVSLELKELPYIVVVVDEFADLMLVAGKDVENAIQRLAQMARAAGIHLIMATQRPSVDVITGVIKANFPTRISFQVTSKIDSRTILGDSGAEQLLGMGDMLYMAPGGRVTRVHGPFVSDEDVEKSVSFLKSQAAPDYIDNLTDDGDYGDSEIMAAMFGGGGEGSSNGVDDLYDRAVAIVAREGKVSTSFVQRHLQIGYNRAARIVEEMEKQGIISPANATGKREILVRDFSDV